MSLADVRIGARFLAKLPSFLGRPLDRPDAEATLRRRLGTREADFLALVARLRQDRAGPYARLLERGGFAYGDIERLVWQEGVEGTLRVLLRNGVYLTVDEFKGRRPAVRGNTAIEVNPARLRNPHSAFHVPVRSSGSRGAGTPVLLDLAFVRDCAVATCLFLEARGGAGWRKGTWEVPGGTALFRILTLTSSGVAPVRWFSQVDPSAPGLHPRYRWSARVLRWGGLLARVPMPRPRFVPVDDPLPIARWMAAVLRSGGVPHLFTFASSAVRLSQAALDAGVDLRGAQLTISGEPVTAARLAAVRRTGAEAVPAYGSIECGYIGYGCLSPQASDDLHLLHDLHAVIQPGPEEAELPSRSLYITSLRSTAPFMLLNVSMGDEATLGSRSCGCPLETQGWTTHLQDVRSYEKLTGGGMAFPDADVIRVLDEVLPGHFGGAPAHYQLVEDEAEDGRPCCRLLVDPAVGPLEGGAVAQAFLAAIGAGSGVERLTDLVWRQGGFLRVERRTPHTTASGKILHLHLAHPPASRKGTGHGER